MTDAAGNYNIGFTATPMGSGFVARAQVVVDGYEEYWRDIMGATSRTTFVENFRLTRTVRIAAGASVVLLVPPDAGDCRGWVAEVCPIVRVTIPNQGNLTIEVMPADASVATPPVEVCCVDGNEHYGNPITIPVTSGPELEVKVGMRRGFTTPHSFLVKTVWEEF